MQVIFSTGADVTRTDYEGAYVERLDMSADAVDLTQLRGAPVLDNHDRWSGVGSILGLVEDAAVDGKRGLATIRFGVRPEIAGIVADVRSGIIRSVSAGYTVQQWTTTKRADGIRIKTATRWTPREISFVPMGADPKAQVRSNNQQTGGSMELQAQIRNIAEAVGVPMAFADGIAQRAGVTIDQARAEIIREAARQQPVIDTRPPAVTSVRETSPDDMARAAGEALYTRFNPAAAPSELGRPFVGRRIADVCRELMRHRGLSTLGSDAEIIVRNLTTTSDLANIVGVLANKIAGAAYQAAPSGVRTVCRQGASHPDFRGRNIIRRGEMPALELVNEHGEFKHGSTVDNKQTYAVLTYGKIFGMSRQLLVNDDLGLLADIAAGWGLAAREQENQLLVDKLAENSGGGPKLSDTVNLFHASHGNLAASGAVISDTTLSAARLALRQMKGISGTVPVNAPPRYLLTPAALETTAEKYLASLYPAQAANVNPFAGKLELVVDPRLDAKSATAWYLFADPAVLPVIEFAYLSGFEGVYIETRNGFEVDGVEIKARLDFGAGGIDFRGAFRNPGA